MRDRPSPTPKPTSHTLASLLDDQERGWRQGERPLVETYLAQHPELGADKEAILDLIYREVLLRKQRGESLTLAEYLARFPQLHTELMIQFQVDAACAQGEPLPGLAALAEAGSKAPAETANYIGQSQSAGGETTLVRGAAAPYPFL